MGKFYTLDDLTAAEKKKILPHLQQVLKLALGTYHDYTLQEVGSNVIPASVWVQLRGHGGLSDITGWYSIGIPTSWRAGIEYVDYIVRLCKAPRAGYVGAGDSLNATNPLTCNADAPICHLGELCKNAAPNTDCEYNLRRAFWGNMDNNAPIRGYNQLVEFLGGTPRSGQTLGLRVLDALDNTPINGAAVTLDGVLAHTNSRGWVFFTGNRQKNYMVTVRKEGYNLVNRGVSWSYSQDTVVTIKLHKTSAAAPGGKTITVLVYDANTKKPVPNAAVNINGEKAATDSYGKAYFSVGSDHIYPRPPIYSGINAAVKITASGYQVATREIPITGAALYQIPLYKAQGPIAEVPDPTTEHGEYMPDATSMTIKVVDAATKQPIAGANVVVEGGVPSAQSTASNGVATFGLKTPAFHIVKVSKNGYYPEVTRVGAGAQEQDGVSIYRTAWTFGLVKVTSQPSPGGQPPTGGGTIPAPTGTGVPTGFFRNATGKAIIFGGAAILLYWVTKKK